MAERADERKRTEVIFLNAKKTLGYMPQKFAFGKQCQVVGMGKLLNGLKVVKSF